MNQEACGMEGRRMEKRGMEYQMVIGMRIATGDNNGLVAHIEWQLHMRGRRSGAQDEESSHRAEKDEGFRRAGPWGYKASERERMMEKRAG
jgi:hypothetical protein